MACATPTTIAGSKGSTRETPVIVRVVVMACLVIPGARKVWNAGGIRVNLLHELVAHPTIERTFEVFAFKIIREISSVNDGIDVLVTSQGAQCGVGSWRGALMAKVSNNCE